MGWLLMIWLAQLKCMADFQPKQYSIHRFSFVPTCSLPLFVSLLISKNKSDLWFWIEIKIWNFPGRLLQLQQLERYWVSCLIETWFIFVWATQNILLWFGKELVCGCILIERYCFFDFYVAGSFGCSNSSALDKRGLEQVLLWGVPNFGY